MKHNIALFRHYKQSAAPADLSKIGGDSVECRPEPLCAALDRYANRNEAEVHARKHMRIPITQELSAIMSISGKFR